MFDLDLFIGKYIYAIEVFVLIMVQEIVNRYMSHSKPSTFNIFQRKMESVPKKMTHYMEHKERYNPDAINIRQSWAIRTSKTRPEAPVQTAIAKLPQVFNSMLGFVVNMIPNLILSFHLSDKPALILPFEPPAMLLSIVSMGLAPGTNSGRTMSCYGLYFCLQFCSTVFASFVPLNYPDSNLNNKGDITNYAYDIVLEHRKWELENVDQELGAFLDAKLSKH